MDRIIGGMPRAVVIVMLVVVESIGAWLFDAGAVTCGLDGTNKGTLPLGCGYQDLNVTGPYNESGYRMEYSVGTGYNSRRRLFQYAYSVPGRLQSAVLQVTVSCNR